MKWERKLIQRTIFSKNHTNWLDQMINHRHKDRINPRKVGKKILDCKLEHEHIHQIQPQNATC